MPALTRGPLPARVYWVRRLLVLGTATLLVVAIARLLGGGSDAASDPGAQLVADGSPTATLTEQPTTTESARKPGKRASRSQEPVLAQPDGPCANEDVAITPKVENAVAGRDVRVVLQLRTLTSDACTWRVSRDSVTVNITSGKDRIWTSRDCPAAIAPRDVIVRKAVTTNVAMVWPQAKRSADGCTRFTGWAMPGWYHVTAAPLGGEPSDLQFELTTPVAGTITKTVTPSQRPSQQPSQSPSGRPMTPGQGQSASPSGAVEPNG
ncbi:hypothetical protein [Nocardioides sp.]|uniref:hypothetical protein n=1 Tax=Nocardioides sp. TaxID=35761 RepID=UPI002612D5AB|nr:hypothetical protein [Nocardioides sp.]MDI6909469.1 hypothetical protein [Nocardioides sp.]